MPWYAKALALLCAGLVLGSVPAAAQQATQTIHLAVRPVMKIALSGAPVVLAIGDSAPGETTATVSDRSTTYTLVANRTARITAALSAPMPEGTRLLLGLDSGLGRSAGLVDVSQAVQAVEVVSDIRSGREAGRTITYTFSADPTQRDAFEGETRTLVFTVLE